MKKLFALLLALAMLFSFAACSLPGGDPCANGHVDKDDNDICDKCGADLSEKKDCSDGHINEDDNNVCDRCGADLSDGDDSYLAPTISEAIAAQLESAASMKIDFSVNLDYSDDGYDYTFNENDELVIEKYDEEGNISLAISIVLSKTEDGVNAKLSMTFTETVKDEDGNPVSEETVENFYIIDGSSYVYDKDLGAYVETMLPSLDGLADSTSTPSAITEIINAVLAELELSEEDKEALIADIGTVITGIFEIVDKKGDFNIDFKPYLDDLFAYVEGIDVETMTLETLLDDIIHLADEELSTEIILNKIKSLASLTVAEAMTELDAWLTENHETTVQGIYDTIVADERVEQLIRTYMGMLGVPEGEDPITEEDIQAFLDELKAIKVDEFIATYVDTDMVLYDLIMTFASSMGGAKDPEPAPPQYDGNPNNPGDAGDTILLSSVLEDEPSYPPINTLFGVIADYLDLSLAEIEESMGMPIFSSIKEVFAGITINALNTSSNVSFTDAFALSELSFGAHADVATALPYEMDETKTEYVKFKFDCSFKISSISDSAVEITLPADAEVIFGIFNMEGFFTDENGTYKLDLYSPHEEDDKWVISGDLYVPDIYIGIWCDMPTEKQDTYVFDYVYYPEDSEDPVTGKLSISFDYENFTYRVVMGVGQ